PYAIATSRTQRNRAALIELERVVGAACIADVAMASETVYIRIAAGEQPALAEAEKWLRTAFPHARANADRGPRVPISFWSWGTYANEVARSITVPVWTDIAHNYPRAVR